MRRERQHVKKKTNDFTELSIASILHNFKTFFIWEKKKLEYAQYDIVPELKWSFPNTVKEWPVQCFYRRQWAVSQS